MNTDIFTDNDFWSSSIAVTSLIAIYLSFRLKQVLLDYILQNSWMVTGKNRSKNWLLPLLTHATIHGIGTFIIALIFNPAFWWLGLVDVVIHSIIDRSKVLIMRPYNKTPKDSIYWWAHGIDQEAHNLTHFVFMLILLLG